MSVRVLIIESERGWGQRVEEEKEFATYAEAVEFCKEYNSRNNLPEVPDIYWYATIARGT